MGHHHRTVAMPLYLLRDEDLEHYRDTAMEMMTELAGESDTPELATVIRAMTDALERRALPDYYRPVGAS